MQIFRFSIWEGRPLPGMALMNLRFRDEQTVQRQRRSALAAAAAAAAAGPTPVSIASSTSGGCSSGGREGASGSQQQLAGGRSGVDGPGLSPLQRRLYCAGAVLLRYAWARLGHAAAASHWADSGGWARGSWRRRCWELMQRGESAYRLASLANFLAFLRTGRYRSADGQGAALPGSVGFAATAAPRPSSAGSLNTAQNFQTQRTPCSLARPPPCPQPPTLCCPGKPAAGAEAVPHTV